MKTIQPINDGGAFRPAEPLPSDALAVVFDGTQYTVYEEGDELPDSTPTRDAVCAQVWEQIKAQRDRLKVEGGFKVTVTGVAKWFHSDTFSRTQQLGLVAAGASVPAVPWKTMDGSFVTLSQALAGQIFAAAMAQDMALFSAAETHKAAMEASADPAAYDFSGGWPDVFQG